MSDICTTMIPADQVGLAWELAALFPGGSGMWRTGLRPIGSTGGQTWYVSSGGDPFERYYRDSEALHAACVNAGAQVTRAQIDALLAAAVVSDGTFTDEAGETVAEGPHEMFARLGLEIVQPEMP